MMLMIIIMIKAVLVIMLMIIIDDHCGVDDSHVDCDEMTRQGCGRIIHNKNKNIKHTTKIF